MHAVPERTTEELPSDGERFLPEMSGLIALEHWHRYLFASRLVKDRDVLDIASGEGYGSAYLAKYAKSVTGVDISASAVAHARGRYGTDNLSYAVGKCQAIPLPAASVDVVVSFETIEHITEHEAMFSEIKRVLRPDGLVVISSPEREEYSDKVGFANPFHVKELYAKEFIDLVKEHFTNCQIAGQRIIAGSVIEGENSTGRPISACIDQLEKFQQGLARPHYLVAIASNQQLPVWHSEILEEDIYSFAKILNRYPDIARLAIDVAGPDNPALVHALRSSWYKDQNQDLVLANVDPVSHWLTFGWKEGRMPSSEMGQLIVHAAEARLKASSAAAEARQALLERDLAEAAESEQRAKLQLSHEKEHAQQEVQRLLMTLAEREIVAGEQVAAANELLKIEREHAHARELALQAGIVQADARAKRAADNEIEQRRGHEAAVVRLQEAAQVSLQAMLEKLDTLQETNARQLTLAGDELRTEREKATARDGVLRQEIDRLHAEMIKRDESIISVRRAYETRAAELEEAARFARVEADAARAKLSEREREISDQLVSLQASAGHEREEWRIREIKLLEALDSSGDKLDLSQRDHTQAMDQLRDANAFEVRALLKQLADQERAYFGKMEEASLKFAGERAATQARELALQSDLDRLRALHAQEEANHHAAQHQHKAAMTYIKQLSDSKTHSLLRALGERDRAAALVDQERSAATSREAELMKSIAQGQTDLRRKDEISQEQQRMHERAFSKIAEMAREERQTLEREIASRERDAAHRAAQTRRDFAQRMLNEMEKHSQDLARLQNMTAEKKDPWTRRLLEPKRTSNAKVQPTSADGAMSTLRHLESLLSYDTTPRTERSVADILFYDNESFVKFAYVALLGRRPEPSGLSFYVNALKTGTSKESIIFSLSQSAEGRRANRDILGLAALLESERRKRKSIKRFFKKIF